MSKKLQETRAAAIIAFPERTSERHSPWSSDSVSERRSYSGLVQDSFRATRGASKLAFPDESEIVAFPERTGDRQENVAFPKSNLSLY
jgi:hypothetical protein